MRAYGTVSATRAMGWVEETSGRFVARVRFRIADDAVVLAGHFAGRVL
jgi:hypothetical protein